MAAGAPPWPLKAVYISSSVVSLCLHLELRRVYISSPVGLHLEPRRDLAEQHRRREHDGAEPRKLLRVETCAVAADVSS